MTRKAMIQNSTPASKDAFQAKAVVGPVKLTDGSYAYNVILTIGKNDTVVLAAEDVYHAHQLAVALNECAWIERA